MRKLTTNHPDLSSICFLFLITCLFFYKVFLGLIPISADLIVGGYYPWVEEGVRVPVKNPLLTDVVSLVYPLRTYTWELVKKGEMPLWNDKTFGGYPVIGSLPTGLYFPTSIFYLLFSGSLAWTLQTIIQVLIAALGMFLLARHLKLGHLASIFSSITYGFSGFSLIYLEWNVQATASSLLPLLILCEDKLITTSNLRWGVGLSVTLAIQIFAGYPPVTLFSLLLLLIWFLFRTQRWREVLKVVSFLLLGVTLSGVLLLPAFELYQHSQRLFEVINPKEVFLPFQYLITLFAPDFFGNPVTGNFFGQGNYLNVALYTGVTTLVLSLIPLNIKKIIPNTKPLLTLFAIVLLISTPNPISHFLYNLGVWGGSSMTMNRSLFLINFALALLAGFGLTSLNKISLSRLLPILAGVLITATGLLVYTFITYQIVSTRNLILPILFLLTTYCFIFTAFKSRLSFIAPILLTLMLIIELFYFGWKFIPFSSPKYLYPQTPLTDFLKSHQPNRFISELDVLPPNMWLPYNLQTISGYDSYYPVEIAKLIAVINSGREDATPQTKNGVINHFSSELLDSAGIKYFVTLKRDLNNTIKPDGQVPKAFANPKFKPVFEKGSVVVFENTQAKPRAYLEDQANRSLDYQVISNDHIRIKVDVIKEAKLVVLDPFYPGWKALVDGNPVEINKFQNTFREVDLPAGSQVVDFYYQPESLKLGLILSLFSGAILLLILISTSGKRLFLTY